MSLCYQPTLTCVQYYFDKRRSLAGGIAYTGTGLGIFGIGPLWRWLMDTYGWRGMLLIHGAITLNGVVLGALHRPLTSQSTKPVTVHAVKGGKTQIFSKMRTELLKTWNELTDPALFRQPLLVLSLVSVFIFSFSHMNPLSFLPDRAEQHGTEVNQ